MNLEELKRAGGIVADGLVKKEIVWKHKNPDSGKNVIDKFFIHVRRQSFGVIESLFAPADDQSSRNAKYIAACVLLGEKGEEPLSYENAFALSNDLGFLFLAAVNEVNSSPKN